MSTHSRYDSPPKAWSLPENLPNPAILAIYVAFAALVYLVHGAEPPLSIDHISYFKLADEIRTGWPNGDYYRTFNSVRAYGVILAYFFDYTGSHITSLKLLLAMLTVGYLAAFQLYMSLATRSRGEAVLFSLLSALFVSFGASIWGMTDFSASLNRTLIVPFVVLLVWFFFRWYDSPWRYALFPGLIVLSSLHLSALHIFLVFCAFEALDFVFRRRGRLDRNIGYFLVALLASAGVQFGMEKLGTGTANYVRYTLNVAVPPAAAPAVEPPAATPPAAAPVPPPPKPKPPERLTPKAAWEIEIFAFPWRNMPPSLPTLATLATSYGVILLLAVWGAVLALRSGTRKRLDTLMLTLAGAVMLAAYGLQTTLWGLRHVMAIFPVNFEEIRAVNNLMFPSVYFIYRLYELAPPIGRMSRRAVRVGIVLAFAIQPILLVRTLPSQWREGIINIAVEQGILKRSDAPRMIYARHFLGLSGEGRRFYYSSRPAIRWLDDHTTAKDLVLTNVDDFTMLKRARTTGLFLNVVHMDVWELRRGSWAKSLEALDRSMATGDTEQVKRLARRLGATYAVVPWPVEGAAYRDEHFSILRTR
jgi:hypothetical protein